MTDYKKALLDPTSVFAVPHDVVKDADLTLAQKIEVLRRWEYDAHELEVAEEEAGMTVRQPEVVDQIAQALHALGAKLRTKGTPPTK
ncbi:MAG: hypothetical protein WBM54_09940 [Woeseia sp.]